jgi:hypothetical protein
MIIARKKIEQTHIYAVTWCLHLEWSDAQAHDANRYVNGNSLLEPRFVQENPLRENSGQARNE